MLLHIYVIIQYISHKVVIKHIVFCASARGIKHTNSRRCRSIHRKMTARLLNEAYKLDSENWGHIEKAGKRIGATAIYSIDMTFLHLCRV